MPIAERTVDDPYLTIVVAARNDNHGGDLLRRMQFFVDCLCNQCVRYGLCAELVIVEWNPPSDCLSLAAALDFPVNSAVPIRIITVPHILHLQYRHADRLHFFQMIAKNVGIRAARGKFVLATNIDILFSEELIAYLATEPLACGCLYRLDRYDVDSDVLNSASPPEAIAHCSRHVLRINTVEGTFSTTLDVQNRMSAISPSTLSEKILFKQGWYSLESDIHGRLFRWMSEEGHIVIRRRHAEGDARFLILEVCAGPSIGWNGSLIQIISGGTNEVLYEGHLEGHRVLTVPLPPDETEILELVIRLGAKPLKIPYDPRHLMMCLMSAYLCADALESIDSKTKSSWLEKRWLVSFRNMLRRVSWIRFIKYRILCRNRMPRRGADTDLGSDTPLAGILPPRLHTNACGDFTLLSKSDWERVCGYAEFDGFSFNIDSLLLYVAHFSGIREVVWSDPYRIYHIEHTDGWTPESSDRLFEKMALKKIAVCTTTELLAMAHLMAKWQCPLITNPHNWGLDQEKLQETNIRG